jgi:hypothetical protein
MLTNIENWIKKNCIPSDILTATLLALAIFAVKHPGALANIGHHSASAAPQGVFLENVTTADYK